MADPEKPSLRALPASTIRLIASSQVVTSVNSAVKELIENALDAGATSIDIKLLHNIFQENSGLDRLEVRDNGSGISPVDAEFMAQPHFTSKITSTDDLSHLQTYGFRGEALGSLCVVSSVTMTTKTEAMEVGITYTLNNKGVVMSQHPSHLGQGTTVTASNLFKSLPVRRQFYNTAKKRKEELRKVEDLVTSFSIICHDVRFSLRHEKETVYVSNPVASCRDVLIRVFGSAVMREMAREVKKDLDNEFSLEMYVPKVTSDVQLSSRAGNERCFIYINKRPVTHKDIEKLLRTYYCHGLSCTGRWPLACVSITLSPEEVDVNLEPNKTRVLVHEKVELLAFVRSCLEAVYGPLEPKKPPNKQTKPVDLNNTDDSLKDLNGTDDTLNGLNHTDDSLNDVNNESLVAEARKKDTKRTPPVSSGMNGFKVEFLGESSTTKVNVEQEAKPPVLRDGEDVAETNAASDAIKSGEEFVRRSSEKAVKVSPNIGNKSPTITSPMSLDIPTPSPVKVPENPTNVTMDADLSRVISTQNMNFDLAGDDFLTSTPWPDGSDVPKLNLNDVSDIASGVSNNVGQDRNCDRQSNNERVHGMSDKPESSLCQNQDRTGDINQNQKECDPVNNNNTNSGTVSTTGLGVTASAADATIPTSENQPATADWSRGICLKTSTGKTIEPVTLLAPGGTSSNLALKPALVDTPKTSCLTPKTTPSASKLQDTPDQPTLLDMMGDATIKRPSSAYIFFCKKIRPIIYEENPGATFDKVARMMSERWKAMSADERQEYEEQAKADSDRYQAQMALQKQQFANKLATSARKRRKLESLNSPCLKQKIPRVDREKKPQVPSVSVHFSMGELRDLFNKGFQLSQELAPNGKLNLIGQLKSHGIWFGAIGNQIQGFHPIRTQEMLIYANLLANHELQADHMAEPIFLRPCYVGGDAAWAALLSLSVLEATGTNLHRYVTDLRVCRNGMKLQRGTDANTGEATLELVGMSSVVNFLGVSDLKEIACILANDPNATLTQCRPNKIRLYLQSEAVRMARQLPQRVSRDEAQDLLDQAQELPSLMCFHNKPCVFNIYDLDDASQCEITS